MNNNKIILISGGTGVGSSTYSLEIAKHLEIKHIISTDYIREILRKSINESIIPSISKSTYLAGQTKNYQAKNEGIKKSEILRGFKNQCAAIQVGIEAIIDRAQTENTSIIIEGVHIIPGKLKYDKNITENLYGLHLEIYDAQTHKKRFTNRQKTAPKRSKNKYIENFQEIRWISEYLRSKAEMNEITIIDNSGTIEKTKSEVMLKIYDQTK